MDELSRLMQDQADLKPAHSIGPPHIGLVSTRNPEVSRERKHIQTTTEDFSPDSLIETPFGFSEGYFRKFFETQMFIQWEEGEETYSEGLWKKPKKYSNLPWPLVKDPSMPMPIWYEEFIMRLFEVENYLIQKGSIISNNADIGCCLCDFSIGSEQNIDFVLKLDAFDPPTQLRWPSILKHYFVKHRVLPSRMFAQVFLERKL